MPWCRQSVPATRIEAHTSRTPFHRADARDQSTPAFATTDVHLQTQKIRGSLSGLRRRPAEIDAPGFLTTGTRASREGEEKA